MSSQLKISSLRQPSEPFSERSRLLFGNGRNYSNSQKIKQRASKNEKQFSKNLFLYILSVFVSKRALHVFCRHLKMLTLY